MIKTNNSLIGREALIFMKTFNIKKILTRFLIVFSLLVLYVYLCSIIYTPSKIILLEGEKLNLKVAKGITVTTNGNIEGKKKDTQVASNINQKNFPLVGASKVQLSLFGNIKLKNIDVDVIPKTRVVPIGSAIGMKLYTKGVLVVGMSQIDDENNEKVKPYEESGIKQGDMILSINNKEVTSTNELIEAVNSGNGEEVNIKYERDNQTRETSIKPAKSKEDYKLGLWVRDVAAGVGTLTFYEPSTNTFMALGHGISDIDTEQIVEISAGELITAKILSISKGEKGKPGEIHGTITMESLQVAERQE